MSKDFTITCTVFDGEKVYENATVTVENGIITSFNPHSSKNAQNCFLMPGLIDGHVHISNRKQIKMFTDCGVTTVCDVSVSRAVKESCGTLNIHTSYTMALGGVEDGKAYVENAAAMGADYIKILLENPPLISSRTMPQNVLQDIVDTAHTKGLKTIVHAVCVPTMEMAAQAGVDILLHTPMKETFPPPLAQQIKEKYLFFMPTLIMMKKFTAFPFGGYARQNYENAKSVVKLLHSYGVPILAGTDANAAFYVPKVKHGSALFDEMELLAECELSPIEVLQAATSKNADAFGLGSIGRIAVGKKADFILVDGRPDKNIGDIRKIDKVYINGNIVE